MFYYLYTNFYLYLYIIFCNVAANTPLPGRFSVSKSNTTLTRTGHRKGSLFSTHINKAKYSSIRVFLLVRYLNILGIWKNINEIGTEEELAETLAHECRNGLLLSRLIERILPKRIGR